MARCSLPSYEWIMRDGYSDDEIAVFERMCREGAHIFYKYAELGGADVADTVIAENMEALRELAKL